MKIAIIPARGGSKRIPRKNIRPFRGKPILAWSIAAAVESGLFDDVMVSTDDPEIADIARTFGAAVPFMRSPQASSDHATTADVLIEVLAQYQSQGKPFSEGCCLYPTAPFATGADLCQGYDILMREGFETVFPVAAFGYTIWRSLKRDAAGRVSLNWPENLNARSQDLPPAYHDAGQWYWFKVDAFLRARVIMGANAGSVILPDTRVQDIDNEDDWVLAELKHERLFGAAPNAHTPRPPTDTVRYTCLPYARLQNGPLSIETVQPAHIETIRQWRNAQMDVLRQAKPIEPAEQIAYFAAQIWPHLCDLYPDNLLVSFFDGDRLIGYGGLVHIGWAHKRAEVSFLLDPALISPPETYARYFGGFLDLLKTLAFADLGLKRLFTETYAQRKHHIAILESAGFSLEGVLRQHVRIGGHPVDSLMHGCLKSEKT